MVSARFSVLLLVAYVSSVAVASKPYAPDLYTRSELAEGSSNNGERMVKRAAISGHQPYAPDLYSRSEMVEDLSQVAKRSPSPSPALEASSWSPLGFLGLREFSEEELHARGKVDDGMIEKRGHCKSDSSCASNQYCSTKKNKCYKKLSNGHTCSRNGACGSGYCCATTDKCEPTRSTGQKCHQNNGACDSGYCSVKTNLCHTRGGPSDGCLVDGGCKDGLSCVNKKCVKASPSHSHHPKPPKGPHHPSPSGSAHHKRSLKHL